MQKIIVWIIVSLAAIYTAIKYYRSFSGKNKGCCGDCSSCGQKSTSHKDHK